MMTGMRERLERVRGEECGFTLIESVVALFIAGIIFSALAGVLISGLQASLYGRQNQQAADFMTRRVEELRRMDFASMAHETGTASSGGQVVNCTGGLCIDVNGTLETLVTTNGGGIAAPLEVLQGTDTNHTRYTIRTYVTAIAGQPVDQARRVTVIASWINRGQERTRSTSTVVAQSQRGLPVPEFKFSALHEVIEENPGSTVTFQLNLTNQGAPDRWNMELSGPGATWSWTLAHDVDGDGVYDPLVDTLLTDTTSDGIVDTGRLNPSEPIEILMVHETSTSDPEAVTETTITATSVGQPDAAGAAKSIVTTTKLTNGPIAPAPGPSPTTPVPSPTHTPPLDCPASPVAATKPGSGGFTLRDNVLHNDPDGNTPIQAQLYMNTLAPDEGILGTYSTDVDAGASGRIMQPMASSAPSDASLLAATDHRRYADWSRQFSKKTSFAGSPVLRVWVARYGAGSQPISVKAVAYSASGSSGSGLTRTAVGSGTASLSTLGCAGFQEVYIPMTLPANVEVPVDGWLGVRLAVVGTEPVRVAYDVSTAAVRPYPAAFTVATK